jgi:RHS repeat-associated protein
MPLSTLTWSNITWYVSGNWTTTDAKCINVPWCILPNWETNPTKPSVINFSTPYVYNSNSISSQNLNASLYLPFYTDLYKKSDNNENISEISDPLSFWDPVRLNTWEFDYDNTLISYNSEWMPFDFKIKYKNKAYYNGPIWNNFDFNYNIYLTEDWSWNINFHDWKLWAFKFTKTSTWYLYNDTINANLTQSWTIYTINFDSQRSYKFWSNFKIETIKDNYWNEIKLTYNDNKELTKIRDTLGREYIVSYYSNSRFKDITDFAWNKVDFIYFWTWETLWSQNDLKTIKMTNSWSIREIWFTYTTWSTFEAAHNIVKLIDSENNTYVENTYDSQDRVSEQKYWNDKIYYDYYMDSWNNYIEKNVVTDRVGNVITYFYNSAGNTVKKLIHKNSWDLEYNYVYDSKGNLIKEIKPLWNWTEYLYDSNNNIIETRIKADMSASWSSSDIVSNATYDLRFNKPTQIISANWLVTNFTYDNNWNVLTKEILWVKDFENNNLTITWSYVYNSKWQLIKEINAKWLETTFEYWSWNLVKIKKWTWSTAIENNFEYDTKWNLVKSIDWLWKETTLTYDDFNLIIQKLSPEAIKTNFTYNKINKKTNEKIVLWTWSWENLNIDYEYDILDNITKQVQDINENKKLTINNKYDDNGKLIETQAGSWVAIKYLYDQNGLIVEKKMETWPTNWDIVTSYTYDSNERIIKETNPRWKETNYEYDWFDRIIKKTLSDWSYEKYYYDKASNIVKIEKKDDGNNILAKEENIYDKRNKIISNLKYVLSDSWATKTSYAKYDENWNLIEKIDPKGNEITYSYDIFDRLTQTQDSLWNKIINTYDKNNNIVSKKVKQSNNKETTTTYAYDDDNRVISETNELNKTKHYEYNKIGQIVKVTDENWNVTDYTYNYDWKLVSEKKHVESENLTTTYEYDERWNMIQVTDAKGNITTYEYDNLSRIIKQTYPDNKEVTYTYDKNSNIKTKTDPNWTVVTNTYDDLDRLVSRSISTWSWVAGVTSENYTYDSLWRLISATDSNNHNLSFTYDSLNRLLQENQSWSIVWYSYDNNNNLLSITNPSNNIINYTYDDINRVTSINKNSDTIADYTYTWLENTSIALWNSTSITKTYDELSRLSNLNNLVKTYNYSYDDVWNITSDSFKNYDYDEIYRLTWVSNSWWTLESLSYDKAGNRINNFNALIWNWANYEYTTNNLNQYINSSWSVNRYVVEEIISEIEWWWSWSGESNSWTWNEENSWSWSWSETWSWETSSWSGNVSGSWEIETWSWNESGSWETNYWTWNTESGSWSEAWSWNIINENTWSWETESSSWETNTWTTNEESSSWSTQEENDTWSWEETNSWSWESWSWVAVWILKKNYWIVYWSSEEESGSWIITYSWWLVNFDDSSNYTYDNNWNIINNWKYKFIYDYKNRIVEVTDEDNESIVSYEYDVLDRRYKKESNSKLVEYTFSNENILEENITNSWSSTITKEYINWLWTDDLIAYDLDNTRYYFNLNHLGSVDSITDNSWNVLINYEYDSYWNAFVNNSWSLVEIWSYTWSTYENDRLFTWREYDGEINLYYLRARYYDSKIWRFISRDPIDISDDVNLYSYVGNNPVWFVDLEWKAATQLILWAWELALDIISNVIDSIDLNKIKYITWEWLLFTWWEIAKISAPICASSISVTTTCFSITSWLALASWGASSPAISLCIPSSITAGGSCLATGAWVWMAIGWGYMMSNSSNNWGNNNGMLWNGWPQIKSKTIKNFEWGWRIDIENPSPWNRPWQLHYQKNWDPNKYYYNVEKWTFNIWWSDWPLAPKNIQNLLKQEDIQGAIEKWLHYLNWLN